MTCGYCGNAINGSQMVCPTCGKPPQGHSPHRTQSHAKVIPFRARKRDIRPPTRRMYPRDYVRWIWVALLVVSLILPYLWHS